MLVYIDYTQSPNILSGPITGLWVEIKSSIRLNEPFDKVNQGVIKVSKTKKNCSLVQC